MRVFRDSKICCMPHDLPRWAHLNLFPLLPPFLFWIFTSADDEYFSTLERNEEKAPRRVLIDTLFSKHRRKFLNYFEPNPWSSVSSFYSTPPHGGCTNWSDCLLPPLPLSSPREFSRIIRREKFKSFSFFPSLWSVCECVAPEGGRTSERGVETRGDITHAIKKDRMGWGCCYEWNIWGEERMVWNVQNSLFFSTKTKAKIVVYVLC